MADVVVAVTRQAIPTSTGNADFTTTDLGGKTPKAALFLLGNPTASDTDTDDALFSLGAATVAGQEWCTAWGSLDGAGTSQSDRQLIGSCIVLTDTNQGQDVEASFVSFITNGVRVNFSNIASAHLLTIVLFAGDDLEAHADVIPEELLDQDDVSDIEDAGFTPDAIFFGYSDADIGVDTFHSRISFGMSARTSPIENTAVGHFDEDGLGTSRINRSMMANQCAYNAKANIDERFEVLAYLANGFRIETKDDDGADLAYLALSFGGRPFNLFALDSPSATGNEAVTGVGFKPAFVFMGLTSTRFEGDPDEETDSSIGASVFTPTEEFCQVIAAEDAAGTTNCFSRSSGKAVNIRDTDDTPDFEADFVSMDPDGFTLDYTVADAAGSVRKWFAFCVAAEAAGFVMNVIGDDDVG